AVRIDRRASLNNITNVWQERTPLRVLDHASANLAPALNHPHDGRLVLNRPTLTNPRPLRGVHVAGLPTDKRLIDFDGSTEHRERLVAHRQPDAVEHEPGRLLSDAERAAKFMRTDSVLAVCREPDRRKPLVESQWRVLKDRPLLHRELPLARL